MAAGVVLLVSLGARPLAAQRPVLLEGLVDGELWATDSLSTLLARNGGRPGALARLRLWGAMEPWRGLVFFANGEMENGAAHIGDERARGELEQAGVRAGRSRALVVEAGKMVHPVGAFAGRRFSTRNPLIGAPDAYPAHYPLGVSLSGTTRRFDYRVAAVSLPVSHEGYAPDPTPRLRPALGAGIKPTAGVHLGVSATWGSYLNDELPASLLAGRPWSAYGQRILAFDALFSRGYLETHAELARSSYDVPARAEAIDGFAYYVEAKYTLSPRLYVAGRFERNDYPFINPISPTYWLAKNTNMYNADAGAGYRLGASTLLKVTYRRDRWLVDAATAAFVHDGHAIAMQLSRSVDVGEILSR